ncbi:hypothetical protein Thiosp_03064 [Thiorhodovibrio litoralis]|nr:hypothetical protein Thiosp_03064 [Thiorhodovibrio litoralis]
MNGPDVGASVPARLLNIAKADEQDFNFVLSLREIAGSGCAGYR